MATKTFQLTRTYSITDIYYIEAKSEEEALQQFMNGQCGEPDDFWDNEDDDDIEIEEWIPDDEKVI